MVSKHLSGWDFVCLSDQELQCKTERMTHNWPGWWAKMELFRIPGPCLYFDLDTILVADCREWAAKVVQEDFVVLRDPYRGKTDPRAMGSGIMAWSSDVSYIFKAYRQNPTFDHDHGDQGFIETVAEAKYIQDFTGSVVSYKADILNDFPIRSATVVYFHGQPRPWDQNLIPY
jgi:hypothetical protein